MEVYKKKIFNTAIINHSFPVKGFHLREMIYMNGCTQSPKDFQNDFASVTTIELFW